MSQLKVTTTITDDVYPESTTIDVQVTDGSHVYTSTKHLPKSVFWSDYEMAVRSILDEVGLAAMRKEFDA